MTLESANRIFASIHEIYEIYGTVPLRTLMLSVPCFNDASRNTQLRQLIGEKISLRLAEECERD
jgi:hypothetical protein